MPTSQTLSYT
ncbi:hypothetical protein F383_29433 [Gossypium arboreum]|uniref:Uncharacterized protein n=1 Tax=Gossypium arboreum TaxID=29729 RepID=A0A0B0PKK4_GOSAR|nr:hypothetical protein F383_29433 [Gossypium arboreum]